MLLNSFLSDDALNAATTANNSFNRSANSVAFMRETMLLLGFAAPG